MTKGTITDTSGSLATTGKDAMLNPAAVLDRSVAPEIHGFSAMSLPAFREMKLDNGAVLRFLNGGEEAVNRMAIQWTVGSVDSPDEAAATLMPMLLREGCSGLSGEEIANILESNGAWLNVAARLHTTVLTAFSLNSTVSTIFPLIAAMISSPVFPENAVESLRRKSASEREIALRKPSFQATILAREALYAKGNPMANTILPADLLQVDRDRLLQVHRGIMGSNRPTIYLSGKIDTGVIDAAVAAFSPLSFEAPEPFIRTLHPAMKLSGEVSRFHEMPDSLQTGVRVVIPTIPRNHPDFEPLTIAVCALGGYFGSRLMENIREDKGYTYGIQASLNAMPEGTNLIIPCECDNRFARKVVEEIDNEIARMASEPLSEAELAVVKSHLFSNMASILDSPLTISAYREKSDTIGADSDPLASLSQALIHISPADIMEITRRYIFQQPRIVALAGAHPG